MAPTLKNVVNVIMIRIVLMVSSATECWEVTQNATLKEPGVETVNVAPETHTAKRPNHRMHFSGLTVNNCVMNGVAARNVITMRIATTMINFAIVGTTMSPNV